METHKINPVLIEFTGVTGAGKTTFRNLVKENLLKQGFCAKYAEEFVLESYNLNFISQIPVRSTLIDLLAFVPFISFLGNPKGRELIRLGLKIILRDSNNIFVKTILLRNFAKRIGTYALLQELKKKPKNNVNCDFILWDEGILQSAHNLFVHAHIAPNIEEIEEFKNLVPQPEIVVWIKASPEKSIQCTLTRGHRRVKKDIELVKKFIDNAYLVFDNLFSDQIIRTNLVIDNSYRHSLEKDNQSLEQQITQVVNLVKADREQVKC